MSRDRESQCRLCRREGEKLFLKGDRCYTDKCAIERREYPPGQHGQSRKKPTEYASQLREKQKIKRIYGVLEKQFRNYFKRADRGKGVTGDSLIQLLESRLDNIVYRIGFGSSRTEARQLICHGHIQVDGGRVDVSSYRLKPGQTISVANKSRKMGRINSALESVERRGVPHWIALDKEKFSATVNMLPNREDITAPMNEQLVVELYSK